MRRVILEISRSIIHWKEGRNVPVAQELVESNDEVLFIRRNVASLDIWLQVIQPSESATLTTSLQTYIHYIFNKTRQY